MGRGRVPPSEVIGAVEFHRYFDTKVDRLQSVMNAAARLVCSVRKYEHITPLLCDLHWLPVRKRIVLKLAVLVFRCLYDTASPFRANGVMLSCSGH